MSGLAATAGQPEHRAAGECRPYLRSLQRDGPFDFKYQWTKYQVPSFSNSRCTRMHAPAVLLTAVYPYVSMRYLTKCGSWKMMKPPGESAECHLRHGFTIWLANKREKKWRKAILKVFFMVVDLWCSHGSRFMYRSVKRVSHPSRWIRTWPCT